MNFLNPYAKIHNMTSLSRGSLYQLNMAKMLTKLHGQIICLDLQSRKGDLQISSYLQSKWSSNWWTQIGIGWLKIVTILESLIILALAITSNSNQLYVKANETIKFAALLIDVNHGFGVFHLKPHESFFVPDESNWMIWYFITHLKKLAFT